MDKLKIVTNNPSVIEEYPDLTEFLEADVEVVLKKVRDYIHLGASLVNHPQSGNIIPGRSPYSSLVIKELDEFAPLTTDFYSLTLIENTIEQLQKSSENQIEYDDETLKDFEVVDLDLLKNALN